MKINYKWILLGLALALIAAGAIYLWNGKKETAQKQKLLAKVSLVSNEKMLFSTLGSTTQEIVFFTNAEAEAGFYQIDLDGKNKKKISPTLDTPQNVFYAPKKDKAILEVVYNKYIFEKYGSMFQKNGTPDNTIIYWLYDFSNSKLSPLETGIMNPSWSPDGDKIAYQYRNEEKSLSTLNVSDPDGKNWQKIADLTMNRYDLGFLDQNNLYFYPSASDLRGSTAYRINIDKKEKIALTQENAISQAKVLENSPYLLAQIFNKNSVKSNLGLLTVSKDDKKISELDFAADFSKLIFLPPNSLIYFTDEKIYQFDLAKKENTQIGLTDKGKIESIFFDQKNNTLYFSVDHLLYKILPVN